MMIVAYQLPTETAMIASNYPTICTDSVAETARFYVDLLGYQVVFDSDWFVQLHAAARVAGLEMPLELRDEDFGQRHFMVTDPNGVLVDVNAPIPPERELC